MLNENGQLVYLIEHKQGPVKIGLSNSPRNRISKFQRACPFELVLRTTIEPINDGFDYQMKDVTFCETLERALQMYYQPVAIRGEWFEVPNDDLKELDGVDTLSAADVLEATYELRLGPNDDGTITDHIDRVNGPSFNPLKR